MGPAIWLSVSPFTVPLSRGAIMRIQRPKVGKLTTNINILPGLVSLVFTRRRQVLENRGEFYLCQERKPTDPRKARRKMRVEEIMERAVPKY